MSNNNSDTKIDYRFKILYALGIFFVVSGHCQNGGISILYDWFPPYAFHLALFTFCSGYFYKSDNKSIFDYIKGKIKRLVLPYYAWNLFYAVFVVLMSYIGFKIGNKPTLYNFFIEPFLTGHQYMYNLGGWYALSLFLILSVNIILRKLSLRIFKKVNEPIYFLFCLSVGFIGVYFASIGYNTGFFLLIAKFSYLFTFFALGIFYRKVLEKYDNMSNIVYYSIIFGFVLFIAAFYGMIPAYTPACCNDFKNGPFMPFITALPGIFFWLRTARLLEPFIGKNKYLNLVADHSYSIMINHFLGFMIVKSLGFVITSLAGIQYMFDIYKFQTDIYYFFTGYMSNFLIIYTAAGIIVPIIISLAINHIHQKFIKLLNKAKKSTTDGF